jgi:hypothetical protein
MFIAANAGQLTTRRGPHAEQGVRLRRAEELEIAVAEVNGEPALPGWSGGDLLGVLVLEVVDERIGAPRVVANPDKLSFAARQAPSLPRPGVLSGS